MSIDLPGDLRDALNDADYAVVLRWWNSLSADERGEISDASALKLDGHVALPDLETTESAPEMQPFYDYLVNHELRCVGFVDNAAAASSYRIVSHYIASLGSDLRHSPGTVG